MTGVNFEVTAVKERYLLSSTLNYDRFPNANLAASLNAVPTCLKYSLQWIQNMVEEQTTGNMSRLLTRYHFSMDHRSCRKMRIFV